MKNIKSMSDEQFTRVFQIYGYEFEDDIFVSNYGEVYNKTNDNLYSYEPSSVNLKIKNGGLKSVSRWDLTISVYKLENKEYEKRRAIKKKAYGYKVQNNIQTDINPKKSAFFNKNDEVKVNKSIPLNNPEIELLKLENEYFKKQNEFQQIKKEYEEDLKKLEILINNKRLEQEKTNKYDNTYFYIIRPKYNNFYMYVGHTINFENRLCQHIEKTKSCCETKLYKTIRDTGGWDSWEMIIIDERICKNKEDALKIEQDWCEKLRPNLNSKSPFA
jgi:predicted GIY-YIG superfamily endonuclease